MTDDPPVTPKPDNDETRRAIPTRIRRLRDEADDAPDHIAPLAALAALVAIGGMTCLPMSAAIATVAARSGGGAATNATTLSTDYAPGEPTTLALVGVLVFFLLSLLGIAGGIGSILLRQWGRRMLLAYAALVLLYLAAATYVRMSYGIEDLVNSAPRFSALLMFFTCVGGVVLVVATLMIEILRHFTRPWVVRRFR